MVSATNDNPYNRWILTVAPNTFRSAKRILKRDIGCQTLAAFFMKSKFFNT